LWRHFYPEYDKTAMNSALQEIQLVCFRLGNSLFAIDIMRVREIIQPQELSSLPTPARFLEGVVNLRGSVIPVMNMRRRFGMSETGRGESGALVIVKLARQQLALDVDEVLEVITVPVDGISPPMEIEDGVGVECIIGVCLHHAHVYMLLGVDYLLNATGTIPDLAGH